MIGYQVCPSAQQQKQQNQPRPSSAGSITSQPATTSNISISNNNNQKSNVNSIKLASARLPANASPSSSHRSPNHHLAAITRGDVECAAVLSSLGSHISMMGQPTPEGAQSLAGSDSAGSSSSPSGYHSAASSPSSISIVHSPVSSSSSTSSTSSSSSSSSTTSHSNQHPNSNSISHHLQHQQGRNKSTSGASSGQRSHKFPSARSTVSSPTSSVGSPNSQVAVHGHANQQNPSLTTNHMNMNLSLSHNNHNQSHQASSAASRQTLLSQANLLDLYPELANDGLALTWFHGANSRAHLSEAIAGNKLLICGDISLAEMSRYPLPIMARPPLGVSDLTLECWLQEVLRSEPQRGIKLTFTSTRTVEPAFRVLARHAEALKGPLVLSADILLASSPSNSGSAPNAKSNSKSNNNHQQQQQQSQSGPQPVDAWTFLMLCRTRFPKSIISIGWCPPNSTGSASNSSSLATQMPAPSRWTPDAPINMNMIMDSSPDHLFELDILDASAMAAQQLTGNPQLAAAVIQAAAMGASSHHQSQGSSIGHIGSQHQHQRLHPYSLPGSHSRRTLAALIGNSSSASASGSGSPGTTGLASSGHQHQSGHGQARAKGQNHDHSHLNRHHHHSSYHQHHNSHHQNHHQNPMSSTGSLNSSSGNSSGSSSPSSPVGHLLSPSHQSLAANLSTLAAAAAASSTANSGSGAQQQHHESAAAALAAAVVAAANQHQNHSHALGHDHQMASYHGQPMQQMPLNLNINEAAQSLSNLAHKIQSLSQHRHQHPSALSSQAILQLAEAQHMQLSPTSSSSSSTSPSSVSGSVLSSRLFGSSSSSRRLIGAPSKQQQQLLLKTSGHHHQQQHSQHESHGYTREMVDKMASVVKEYNLSQPVTFPVQAKWVRNSMAELQRLLYQVGSHSSITVVASQSDLISVEDLVLIRKSFSSSQLLFDLPEDMTSSLRRELADML